LIPIQGRTLSGFLFLSAVLFATACHAETEYATFESFYQPGWSPMWWLAGLAALVGAGAIFFTGGTASPIVVGIGTWIGGLMGFSGIAATNAGLALLGGGSIASGGFGIVGGAALLTAALTFSTEVVIDYGSGKAMSAYSYSKFSELSKDMTSLPLPKNKTGPDSYKAALEVLEQVDDKEPIMAASNQQIIEQAVEKLSSSRSRAASDTDQLREESLLALLMFLKNDYSGAKTASNTAYALAHRLEQKATLPAFIYSTAVLYDTKPDVDFALRFFAYSVTNEETPLTPLLFAIILDRAMYRMNDGAVTTEFLDRLFNLSKHFDHDKRKAAIQLGILNRYFIRLKLEQQAIITLARSESQRIRGNKKTLDDVNRSLANYKIMLLTSRSIVDGQYIDVSGKIKDRWVDRDWEKKWLEKLENQKQLWAAYDAGTPALEGLVHELEAYQQALAKPAGTQVNQVFTQTHLWLIALFTFILGMLAYRRIGLRRS